MKWPHWFFFNHYAAQSPEVGIAAGKKKNNDKQDTQNNFDKTFHKGLKKLERMTGIAKPLVVTLFSAALPSSSRTSCMYNDRPYCRTGQKLEEVG